MILKDKKKLSDANLPSNTNLTELQRAAGDILLQIIGELLDFAFRIFLSMAVWM